MEQKVSRGLRSNIMIIEDEIWVIPTDIVDNFGDKTLSCPNCKEPVYFKYGRGNSKSNIPDKCQCGAMFNWWAFANNICE